MSQARPAPSPAARPRSRPAPVGLLMLAAAAAAFGLFVSYRYIVALWAPEPDSAVPLAIWTGLQRYGWSFIPSWNYTPDNWLLSLVPLDGLVFSLAGGTPAAMIAMGWLIFAASVAMTTYLGWRLTGLRAAAALGAALAFANPAALGPAGYLGYSVSHNISMAWALAALILALEAVAHGSILLGLLAGACVFVDAVSDPWATPGIALPLILASLGVGLRHRRGPALRGAAAVFLASALALWAVQSQAWGSLSFLSTSTFHVTTPAGVLRNLWMAARDLAAMANVVPDADLGSKAVLRLDAVLLGAVMLGAAGLAAWRARRASPDRQLAVAAALLSIVGVASAYAIGEWPQYAALGRWFPNVYFLGALLVAYALAEVWYDLSPRMRLAAVAYPVLFALSGALAAPALWTGPAQPKRAYDAERLAGYLAGQGLSYGYGPYWGAHSLVIAPVSGGRVTIRPVTFTEGRVRRRVAETSSFWYRASDEPLGLKERFVIVKNDGESCLDLYACAALAVRQFGEPDRRLEHEGFVVLVWRHPIAGRIAP